MWRLGFAFVCLVLVSSAGELPGQENDFGRGKPEGKPRLVLDTGGHTAQVRALVYSSDGQRLYSAGLDKIVMGWEVKESGTRFRRTSIESAQTLHWEISRGMRGTIMELATPADGPKRWLAIGGVSARNGGDVTVYDAAAGHVERMLTDLQGAVATGGLTFSPDGSKLAAVSVFGDAWVWSVPDFKATPLRPFETRHEEKVDRPYRALAFLTNNVLAAAIPFGDPELDRWNIALYDLSRADGRAFILRHEHQGAITAIVRDPHSPRWATADKGGEVFLWEGFAQQTPKRLPTSREPLDVTFGPQNSFFVATRLAPQKDADGVEAAYLEHWRLDPIRPVDDFVTSTQLDNYACTISPDQKWLATCGDDDAPVLVFPLRDSEGELIEKPLRAGQRPFKLRGMGSALGKVAFAVTEKGEYQVGFGAVEQSGRARDFNRYGAPRRIFDLTAGRLLPEDTPLPGFQSPEDANRQWTVKVEAGRRRLLLTNKAKHESCTITLDPSTQGEATCYCFLAEGETTFGLAVGTNHQNGVFVYELVKDGECPLLRYYRDHNYVVTSLSVSPDGRYLASASLDQTIKIWSLDGLRTAGKGEFRHVAGWGADFVKSGGNLVAENVNPPGIAFARGIRDGDIVDRVARVEDRGPREHQGADKILAALNDAGLFEQLTIKVNRNGRVEELPQIVPAWEPVATLFVGLVDGREEWALFTPQGPYQTSVNGDQLFGWQYNMGLGATPEFFRAERLRGELERPDVLLNLFKSYVAELMDSQLTELAASDDLVRRASLRTPVVKILSPLDAEGFGAEAPVSIRARIFYPEAAKPSEYNVFALLNGGDVGRPRKRTIESKQHRTEIVEWQIDAGERDNRLAIQVQKKGDPLTTPFDHQFVKFRAEVPGVQPKLHTLLIAAAKYPRGRLELPYPVDDAKSLAKELRSRSGELYQPGKDYCLFDEQISQAQTPAEIEQIAEELKTAATPGDLLVIYIAGHGAVYGDVHGGKYYFVPPDEKLRTLEQQDRNLIEQIGLPWDSLLPLRETPCRKLVFLDTCHSGNAVLENDSLGHHKALTRPLRQSEMLIVSATSVGQSARGVVGKGGYFTQCLRDGLAGFADGVAVDENRDLNAADAEVDALELVRYVTAEVPRRTRAIEVHTPMHSPEQLFKTLHIPLTRFNPVALQRAPVAAAPAQPAAAAAAK